MLVVSVLVLASVIVAVYEYVRSRGCSRLRQLSKFPGDFPLPLIGNALQLGFNADDSTKNLKNLWRKFGKTSFRLTVGSEDWVMLCEPDDVEVILRSRTEVSKSPERNTAVRPFFGNSVSTSSGERWRSMRKAMLPSLTTKTLEQRVHIVNKHSERLVEIFSDYEDKGPVDLYRYLKPFMFDVISEALMGVDSHILEDPKHPYVIESAKVINMITQNFFSYWRNIQGIFELTRSYREMRKTITTLRDISYDGVSDSLANTEMVNFDHQTEQLSLWSLPQETRKKICCPIQNCCIYPTKMYGTALLFFAFPEIISQRKSAIKDLITQTRINNKNSSDEDVQKVITNKLDEQMYILDRLIYSRLPNGETPSDEIINEEISFVCFTGHFTTSMTISHTLYCLAKHPETQKRVIEEQYSIFKGDFSKNPTTQDLNDMKYLDAVIKESIRLIPTVSKIGRKLTADLTMKDGRVIPAKSTVIVYYEGLFQNDKVFPEPYKFIPERFFDKIHPYAFMPFGGGPRSCIGFKFALMAMKATLCNILRRFEVEEGGPGTEPQFAFRIVTESKNGIHLKFKKRK